MGPEKASCCRVQIFGLRLPPPTLNGSRPQPADEDEPTGQPTLGHTTELPTLPTLPMLPAVSDAPGRSYQPRPHRRQRTSMDQRRHLIHASQCLYQGAEWRDGSDEYNGSEGRSHTSNPRRFVCPRLSCEVDGSAVLIFDKAADPPIAFSACLSPPQCMRGPPTLANGRRQWTGKWKASIRMTSTN